MKAKLSYKSKRNIIITVIILSLLAIISVSTYFFIQGNDSSQAFMQNNSQTEYETETMNEIQNTNENQENIIEPDIELNENVENETSNNELKENENTNNSLETNSEMQENINEEYITERIEEEEVLVSENYEVDWQPMSINVMTTTKEFEIIRPIIIHEKTTDKATAISGDEIEYIITVTNIGNLDGVAIIQDKAPDKTTFKKDSIKINNIEAKHEDETFFTEEELVEGIALDVKIGETVTLSFKVIVDDNVVGTIINTAIVNEEETNSVKTPILKIEKISEVYRNEELVTVAKVGDTIKYKIKLTNTSKELDITTNVQDKVPEGTRLIEESITDGGSLTNTDGTITWKNIFVEKENEEIVGFSVKVNEGRNEIIRNTATVEEILTNEVENPIIDIEIIKAVYNLNNGPEIEKNTTVTVKENDIVGYKITVTNIGDVKLNNVKVTDNRKVYLDYNNAVESEKEGNKEVATEIELAPGETKSYIVYYKVTADDVKNSKIALKNVVEVIGEYIEDDEVVETIEDSDDEKVNIAKVPKITTIKERVGSGKAEPGDIITYKITVTNSGNTDLTNVKVYDDMNNNPNKEPRNINITNITVSGKSRTWTEEDNVYNIGDLAIGENAIITATYKVTEKDMAETEQTIINVAKSEALSDGDVVVKSEESKVEVKTKVWKANIKLEKTSQLIKANPNSLVGATTAEYGDKIKYTITATNTGRKEGSVVVKDYIPAGAELVEYNSSDGTTNLSEAEYNKLKSATKSDKFSKKLTVEGNDGTKNGTKSIYFTVKVTAKPGSTIKNIATDGRDGSDVPEPGNSVEKVVEVTKITEVPVVKNSNVVIVLDLSRTMNENNLNYEGASQSRLSVAKKVINKFIDSMDLGNGSEVTIITFAGPNSGSDSGKGYSQSLSFTSGGTTKTIAKTKADGVKLKDIVSSLEIDTNERGTLISGALLRAKDKVGDFTNTKNKDIVIFVGDGEPEGDSAENLIDDYVDDIQDIADFYVVGFGTSIDTLKKEVPTDRYFDVRNENADIVFNTIGNQISPATPVNVASSQGKITLTDVDTSKKVTITVNNSATPIERTATSSTYVIDLKEFGANASIQIQYYKKKN